MCYKISHSHVRNVAKVPSNLGVDAFAWEHPEPTVHIEAPSSNKGPTGAPYTWVLASEAKDGSRYLTNILKKEVLSNVNQYLLAAQLVKLGKKKLP